ncbi:ATP-dependent Clp protease ATP-binding subunit ClpA [Aliarcobacter thereius]|uniref:Chaperone protein ClpB n=2 Tax=Aliarcobacter thereius TaxID=544718 RepID=A0A5R9H4H7_9BACT|nr:ATP-dependent Clp protease ATP-binding subunit ClpA [Aliarcobacter thereius]OCL92332.1 ATP-dependent Clp protease ATP-binding subunit ClpA [Aliarcobacter thereius]OCL94573.1 ATP-dependent Clp protease ATP-binding subunit ClpA [Aliarcobacter thereius LMG 24486]QBF15549.1 ATP-dependent protease specificity component and chaperone [Aliarcobacter thereius LMG 24486]TLS70816.1 ATP-dependent Clp protease ATP-binding subunit ClpA [Aliarcobacter thereius]TLS91772.1 ATP-dependent Clp protease ATP-bi
MISKELREVFSLAINFAKRNQHEYLTLEHVFLMLINSNTIKDMFNDLGVDSKALFEDLKEYITSNTPKLPDGIIDEPIETVALSSTIEYMVAHTQGSGKTQANVEDMFVAILKDEKSYSTYLLKKLGIQRVDILEEISHKEIDEHNEDSKKEEQSEKILEENSSELVAFAEKSQIDPVIGRDKEIARVIEILSRRKKNNPLLVGEPGVGKTAIAEGLALKIAKKEVPSFLEDAKIFSLDMASMLAGTKYRGDFEKKLKSLLKEIAKIPNAILFIDEIHTIVGAGSVGGSAMDASNILKPLLANGKLRCIGATTFSEYRNDFEKDKALSRRFAKVDINEPSIEDSIIILEGLKSKYEEFHKVKYSKASIISAVELSKKYINDRFLPDCAIDVIDEVGASKKISMQSTLKTSNESNITITQKDVEDTIAKMAHIPSRSATKNDLTLLKSLEKNMQKRVFGQDEAIIKIIQAIKINKAGLGVDKKPIGSFLFTGPTGVGKTEVAKELSLQMGIHFERFDMSEYMEAHAISRLIGAPAGYIGYEKGGLLTESIRKHPHSVLLLDEIEKAHPDLMSILLQVMDNAELTDNAGNKADFQNVILIMTSNLGVSEANVMGFAKNDKLNENRAINRFFAPEFRNRLDSVISFESLSIDVVSKIVGKFIEDLEKQLESKKIKIEISKKAKDELAILGYDKSMGARPLNRVISEKIKNILTDEILFGKLKKGGLVKIDFKNEFLFDYIS